MFVSQTVGIVFPNCNIIMDLVNKVFRDPSSIDFVL